MGSVRLFVYGSLKRGGRHHAELRGGAFLAEARTEPGYALVPLGEYLALERSASGVVSGELFEISEALLPVLDAFEGEDYRREELWLTLLERSGGGVAAAAEAKDFAENAEKCRALAYLRRTR